MSGYTKGPWVVVEGDMYDKEIVISTEERLNAPKVSICEMDIYFTGEIGEEQMANVHLISAAPELLKALEGLLSDIEGLISESDGVHGLHLNGDLASWGELEEGGQFERLTHISTAHAAIAKAKGEQA